MWSVREIKRILPSVLLVCCLLLCGCSGGTVLPAEEPSEFPKGREVSAGEVLLQNESFEFLFNTADCTFTLTERATGNVWRSNPPADYEDPLAASITKTDLKSQLIISYKQDNTSMRDTNSASSSVLKKNFKVSESENGIRVDYSFNEGFTVPVLYSLNNDGFTAAVLYSEITENDDKTIYSIKLLPFFGAAGTEDNGYIFVPDGSGAVIDFNNGKKQVPEYSKLVYGADDSLPNYYETTRSEEIRLPVFGMKKEDGGFLAVIEEGDGFAYINASVSGVKTALNTVCASGVYRATERLTILNGSLGTAGNSLYTSLNPTSKNAFQVRYIFLEPENSGYSGMAGAYRKYLTEKDALNKSNVKMDFTAEIYDGVNKKMSLAGFQYEGLLPLTDFEEAKSILEELRQSGVNNFAAAYIGIGAGGYSGKLDIDLKPVSKLGGKKSFAKLSGYAEENGIQLFAEGDFYSFSKSGSGFSRVFDVSKTLDMSASVLWYKGLNTNIRDNSRGKRYLLKPALYEEAFEKMLADAEKYGINGLSIDNISNRLSGDYSSSGAGRQRTADILSELFKDSEIPLCFKIPNAYLLGSADAVRDIPVASSGHLLFDRDVPFYQMVIRGSLPYTGYAVNLNNTGADIFLKHIESLTGFTYGFMAASPEELQTTDYINLYGLGNVDYETVSRAYEVIERLNSYVKDAVAVKHEAQRDTAAMTYSNGVTVIVNYSSAEQQVNGITVPARGFAAAENGVVIETGSEVLLYD